MVLFESVTPLPMTIDSYEEYSNFDKAVGLHFSESHKNKAWWEQTGLEVRSCTLEGRHAGHYSTGGSEIDWLNLDQLDTSTSIQNVT